MCMSASSVHTSAINLGIRVLLHVENVGKTSTSTRELTQNMHPLSRQALRRRATSNIQGACRNSVQISICERLSATFTVVAAAVAVAADVDVVVVADAMRRERVQFGIFPKLSSKTCIIRQISVW